MLGRLRTIIASASVLLQLSSANPADPTITAPAVLPRQNSDTFIGYVELNNTWSSLDCNSGLTWYQSGQYAQCCPATLAHCYAPTACVGGSQIYTYPDLSPSVSTIACTDNYNNPALSVCNTIFIFENTQDSNPRTNINCGDSSAGWSYYRDIPPESTTTTSSMSGTTTSTPVPPALTSSPVPSSKAWIAGAVVGPILGFALIGAGFWLFLRRRKRAVQLPQRGSASMAPIDPNQPPTGVGGYTDAKPEFHLAQPPYYDRTGQLGSSAQKGYPQQGASSSVPQYGIQSAYNATADPQTGGYTYVTNHEGIGGTAELVGDDSGISSGAVPVSELSGVEAKQSGEGLPGNGKPN
ncbi:hypothetical protein E8E12_003132 [Didymella heteroderae]|uniref:Uncharacterized protein n=1 Tax=Didymella heteroderae TaxID=1769908 RepID=A0A9P4WQL3_9PLEO|nr:hypothetical protein E8E12_003132 [Didymella heteroderae]